MSDLQLINTSSWSNIPSCLTQAINLLIDKSTSNVLDLSEIKESLSDLIIKFQVKTSRLDTTLSELTNSFKTFSSTTSKEISELKSKSSETSSNSDKKVKQCMESLNELKNKQTSFYSEFRKENREFNNKFERQKTDIEEALELNYNDIKKYLDQNEKTLTKKLMSFTEFSNNELSDMTKRLRKAEEELIINKIELKDHQDLLNSHTGKLQTLSKATSESSERLESIDKEILDLSQILQTITAPQTSKSPQKERKKTIDHTTFVNPLLAKISELEDRLESFESSQAQVIKSLELSFANDLVNVSQKIETSTIEHSTKLIKESFEKLKEKLEWLPDKSYDMKGMTVTEARLFLIESRLRIEEKARIVSDQKLQVELNDCKGVSSKNYRGRRSSLTPNEVKTINIELDKKNQQRLRTRPSSSYQNRELMISQEKLRDKFSVKILEAF